MSSVSSTRTSSTSFPSPTQNQGGDNRNTPGSFYRNLFYILIGLLAAFGLISFLSLLRARRRRRQIIGEAARLGVLVPGVPGYIPIRERHAMNWTRADGSENPDWWEVEGKKPLGDRSSFDQPGFPATRQYQHFELDFQPLAVIPPANRNNPSEQPIPRSELPFFPNHLAYRPESLLPPPSRFSGAQPESLDQLEGESVEVLTIIKMPSKDWPESRPVDETEEVVKEWAAMEIGIARLDVTTGR